MERFLTEEDSSNNKDWIDELLESIPPQEEERDTLSEEVERVGTFFKGVCDRIAETKPDHVIFLDAGARAFGIPFVKYMNAVHNQKCKAEYWDDDKLRDGESDGIENFIGQHLVFVDDVIWKGRNLKALENLAKAHSFTYEYVALSKHASHERKVELSDEQLPEYLANDFSGEYMGGNIAGKQRNSLYIRDADEDRKTRVRDDVTSYQNAILETMLSSEND
jgi:adenine/guanine phosphoribosyltransferase-like PRPP-binding protein